MMGEWTWGAGEEGETGPVSDKDRYYQVITSDKTEKRERRGRASGETDGEEG